MSHRRIDFILGDSPPARLDKALARDVPEEANLSRTRLGRLIADGAVTLDGVKVQDPRAKVAEGQAVQITVEEAAESHILPEDIPLSVVFEDDDLIVIDKPAGMVVHPGDGTGEDTLVHALLHHCDEKLSTVGAPERPGIVHRLDKDTSGVMVVAKTDPVHYALVKQFAERETGKEYLALVSGIPREKSGSVTLPIGRHPTIRVKMAVVENGKPAHTDWEIIESFGDLASLIRCRIHTGRTHQIRVHLSSLGHPVLGDETYGFKPARSKIPSPPRVLLHAQKLSFTHPANAELMTVEAPAPVDFSDYLELLK